MLNKKIAAVLGTLIVVTALFVLPCFPTTSLSSAHARVQAQNPDQGGCSLATLQGGYGLTFHGFAGGPPPVAAFIPVAGAGLVTFDGAGNLSLSETVSVGGQILPLKLSGTYLVNPDCTGSLTTSNATELNLVIVFGGREILAINTNPGRIAVDDFIKQ